jgi:hypothetical protein
MKTTALFSVSIVGQRTGKPYNGKFTVKTVLSRRENFLADERRRLILGSNSAGAPPSLQGEAFMLGQLFVRLVEAPDWWKNADNGLDLEDENVIGEIYQLTEAEVASSEKELADSAKTSLNKLANSTSKKPSQTDKEE